MNETLNAIAWAATKAGESYGTFIINLSHKERERIKEEYKAFLEKRERDAEERAKKFRAGIKATQRKLTAATKARKTPPRRITPPLASSKNTHQLNSRLKL